MQKATNFGGPSWKSSDSHQCFSGSNHFGAILGAKMLLIYSTTCCWFHVSGEARFKGNLFPKKSPQTVFFSKIVLLGTHHGLILTVSMNMFFGGYFFVVVWPNVAKVHKKVVEPTPICKICSSNFIISPSFWVNIQVCLKPPKGDWAGKYGQLWEVLSYGKGDKKWIQFLSKRKTHPQSPRVLLLMVQKSQTTTLDGAKTL